MRIAWLSCPRRNALLLAATLMAACTCEPNLPRQPARDAAAGGPQVRLANPIARAEGGTSASLLQAYAGRGWADEPLERTGAFTFRIDVDPQTGEVRRDDSPTHRKPAARMTRFHALEPSYWELPFHSKRMVAALLATAADDDLERLPLLLTPDATFGLPDTRMMEARPVFARDGGAGFLQALRAALARMPAAARWVNPMLVPGLQVRVRSGALPYWSYFDNGMDRIYFRAVVRDGQTRFDYLGFFRQAPTQPTRVEGKGPPPPLLPPMRRDDGAIVAPAIQGTNQR